MGKWYVRVEHATGVRSFSAVHKPQISYNDGGSVMHLVVDESLFIFSTAGLSMLWRFYVPRDGEEVPLDDAGRLS